MLENSPGHWIVVGVARSTHPNVHREGDSDAYVSVPIYLDWINGIIHSPDETKVKNIHDEL